MRKSLPLCVSFLLFVLVGAAPGQNHFQYSAGMQAAIEREAAAQAAEGRARHQQSIATKQRNAALKRHQSAVVPLDSDCLQQWKKVQSGRNVYWQYDIKRNKATVASAYYSPKVGYVVDDKFQKSGLGWLTLDEAIQKKFNQDQLFTLPDIPGWAKSHLLTSDEQIADMKRQALAQAKPRAVRKIADNVADGIVDKVGPGINRDIGIELGVELPAQKPAKMLQFKKLDEDADVVRYCDVARKFLIQKHKDGSGFDVSRKDGKKLQPFDEVFTSLEDAVAFASAQPAK